MQLSDMHFDIGYTLFEGPDLRDNFRRAEPAGLKYPSLAAKQITATEGHARLEKQLPGDIPLRYFVQPRNQHIPHPIGDPFGDEEPESHLAVLLDFPFLEDVNGELAHILVTVPQSPQPVTQQEWIERIAVLKAQQLADIIGRDRAVARDLDLGQKIARALYDSQESHDTAIARNYI